MDYKEIANRQNMEVARAKAIDVLKVIEEKCTIDFEGMAYYELEDIVTDIINSK